MVSWFTLISPFTDCPITERKQVYYSHRWCQHRRGCQYITGQALDSNHSQEFGRLSQKINKKQLSQCESNTRDPSRAVSPTNREGTEKDREGVVKCSLHMGTPQWNAQLQTREWDGNFTLPPCTSTGFVTVPGSVLEMTLKENHKDAFYFHSLPIQPSLPYNLPIISVR